jgi:hypothetical protein
LWWRRGLLEIKFHCFLNVFKFSSLFRGFFYYELLELFELFEPFNFPSFFQGRKIQQQLPPSTNHSMLASSGKKLTE